MKSECDMIKGFNKFIACEPYAVQDDQDKNRVSVGRMQLKVVSQRTTLIPLKVIYGSEENDIDTGDVVYVTQAGQNQVGMTSQWAKSIDIDLGEGRVVSVVMVPLDQVQLVDRRKNDLSHMAVGRTTP
jgi:hypothetical protein